MSEMNPIPFAKALGKPSQAAIDSAVSDWLDDHPEATTTVEDGSITKAKLDSNLQGTVDDVADLKSAFNNLAEEKASKNKYDGTATAGYLNESTGVVNSSTASKVTGFIPVSSSFVVSVDNLTNTAFRYCIYNASKQFVAGGYLPTFSTSGNRKYLALTNANAAYIRFSDYNARMDGSVRYMVEDGNEPSAYEAYFEPYYQLREGKLADADQEIITETANTVDEGFEKESYIGNIKVTPNVTAGYMASNGTIYSSENLSYTQKISVIPGDILKPVDTTGVHDAQFRFVCAFNDNTVVQSAGKEDEVTTYTVPEGINGVIVTLRNNQYVDQISITRAGVSIFAKSKQRKLGYMKTSGDLSAGESLSLPVHNVKNNCVIAFTARITSFSKLKIGKNASGTPYIVIDGTNISLTNNVGTITTPDGHGLTIANTIGIRIENENSIYVKRITLESDGNVFTWEPTNCNWIADSGAVYAVSDGSTLTDCVLSWTSRNINSDVWVFGDSYISFYPQRWAYYLIENGYADGVMFNGYAGENSANAMIALENLIDVRMPNTVVWCLGMNDADGESTVNTAWKANYDKLLSRSKQYGFNIVLATIPAIPTNLNNYKNAIVRDSGYQYIDFAKSVNVGNDGTWIDGTLDTDETHPTVTGAKILYSRAIADCPQLITN